jgi:internalin A
MLDSHGYPSPKEHQFIIDMLQKFEMCFPLPDEPHTYLIPQLLQDNEPDLNWDKAASLLFQYHYDILPHSVFSRFIVRLHENISQKTYWRTGVVLQHECNKALVTADIEDKKIFVWVNGDTATRRELLAIIRKEFRHIHRTIKGLSAKARIPYKHITVDYKHLLFLESIGQTSYFPEGLKEIIQVQALLSGVDLPKTQPPQPAVTVHGDYIAGDKPMSTITQTITNSTIHGSVLAAETISNCLNTVQQADTAPDLKAVLNELLENIKALNNQATATQAPFIENLSRETDTLITEIASPQPRKRYALLSLEGIKEAAISL